MHLTSLDGHKVVFGVALTLVALAGGTSTAAAQCGQDYRAAPSRSSIPGGPPLAIGDSVLADAVPLLAREGFEADGMVCRQMDQGIDLLRSRGARLPHLVVLALGTNGQVGPEEIDTALAIIGPSRTLVLVTPHGAVVPSTPQVLRVAAASHPGRVVLLDWDRLALDHENWFAPDGVHLSPTGKVAFARMLAGVLPNATPAPVREAAPAQPGAPITLQPPADHPHSQIHHHPAPTPAGAPARGTRTRLSTATTSSTAPATNRSSGRPVDPTATQSTSSSFPFLALGVLAALLAGAVAAVWRFRRR